MSHAHTHPVEHPSTHAHLHLPADTRVHRLDPAAKLIGLIGFVVVVAVTPRTAVAVFAIEAASLGVAMAIARVPFRTVLSRIAVIVPFVLVAAVIPFIAAGPRHTLGPVSVSETGLWAAWGITAKAGLGASASALFAATTPIPEIVESLGRLHLPSPIVSIVAFMFRYLDLLADRLTRMRQSMTARCYRPGWLWQTRPIAQSAGALFVRTYERGERVHHAMLARGYDGKMPVLQSRTLTAQDVATALLPAGLSLIAMFGWMLWR